MNPKESSIRKLWDDSPALVKLALIGGAGYLAYRFGRSIYDEIQIRKRLKLYQQSGINFNVNTGSGTGVTTSINLSSIAMEIYDALGLGSWYQVWEDEDRVINAVKQVPKVYIPDLERTYLQLYQRDLRQDLVAYLDGDEWNQISYLFT
jgi:hypothetical protein